MATLIGKARAPYLDGVPFRARALDNADEASLHPYCAQNVGL